MGILSALFGAKAKKKDESLPNKVSVNTQGKVTDNRKRIFRGVADVNGLYPSELIMLAVAEKYATDDTNYPGYLSSAFEVMNPSKVLHELHAKGYLETSSSKDVLPDYTISDLKSLAASLNVQVKGKKADIISQLSQIDDKQIDNLVKKRKWKLTDKGISAINSNRYISYFLEKYKSDPFEIGVDIWSVNRDIVNNPRQPFRDVIYRQMNEKVNEAALEIMKNPMGGSYATHYYCDCTRAMALFLEEEKSYENAADMYFEYIFRYINIQNGLQFLISYKLLKGNRQAQKDLVEKFGTKAQLYDFQRKELLRFIDNLDKSNEDIRNMMIICFRRSGDSGIMEPDEVADYLFLALSGNDDAASNICKKAAMRATKKI